MASEKKKGNIKKQYLLVGGVVGAIAVIVITLMFIFAGGFTPVIALENEEGNPITASKVILDGKDLGYVSGKVEIGDLENGNHTIIIIWDDVEYEKTFYYEGKEKTILIQLSQLVETIVVEVTDKLTGESVENAEIYLDGVYEGKTSVSGNLEISNVNDGVHQIEVTYKDISESKSVTVTFKNTFFSFSISVPRDVFITVYDKETELPIREMDVYVDGEFKGTTTRDGQLFIEGILSGHHTVGLDVPGYSGMVNKYIEVGTEETISLDVDVPNPIFQVGVEAHSYWWFDEVGNVKVTLSNVGEINSMGTSVLVLVYREDDLTIPIVSKVLDFPSLVPRKYGGSSETMEWEDIKAFVYGPREVVVVVIFDGWPYTPQNNEVVNQVMVPSSMFAELACSVIEYLTGHPEFIINTIAKIAVAWLG